MLQPRWNPNLHYHHGVMDEASYKRKHLHPKSSLFSWMLAPALIVSRVTWAGKHLINTCSQWGRNINKTGSNHVRNIHSSFIRNRNTKLRPYVYRLKKLTRKPSSSTNLRKNPLLFLCSLLARPGDEVDAGPWHDEQPAVVVERPHLPLQRLHQVRLEFCKASPISQSL